MESELVVEQTPAPRGAHRRGVFLQTLVLVLGLPLGGCVYEAIPASQAAEEVAASPSAFNVRGELVGLTGSGLVLQNNGLDDIGVGADGSLFFPMAVSAGSRYDVSISLEPTFPIEHCRVENGQGTVTDRDVTDVRVICTTAEFVLGGDVTGLDAVGLVLANVAGDAEPEEVALASSGTFAFLRKVETGKPYAVRVAQQPDGATCEVDAGSSVMGTTDRHDVHVWCRAE